MILCEDVHVNIENPEEYLIKSPPLHIIANECVNVRVFMILYDLVENQDYTFTSIIFNGNKEIVYSDENQHIFYNNQSNKELVISMILEKIQFDKVGEYELVISILQNPKSSFEIKLPVTMGANNG